MVAACTLDKSGLGRLNFTPVAGVNYKVAGNSTTTLPVVKVSGFSLRLDSLKAGRLIVQHRNMDAAGEYFLFMVNKGRIIQRQKLELQGQNPLMVDAAVALNATDPVAAYVLDNKEIGRAHV